MNEKLLQFIWQLGYFNKLGLQTTQNEFLQIINLGQLNNNQGPDFLQATIKIGHTTLVGSVELHIKTSDWQKHKHTNNPQYKNVILHVVYENDVELSFLNIPVLELKNAIAKPLLNKYETVMNSQSFIACQAMIKDVKSLTWNSWQHRLLVERLTQKSDVFKQYLTFTNNNWEQSFFILLCRNFGGTVNADAFEELAKNTPINIITKHCNNLLQLEALLLGQANLLNNNGNNEPYFLQLKNEYEYLKQKLGLTPSNIPIYFLRMRPANFATVRLAQLAALLHKNPQLLSYIKTATTAKQLHDLFSVQCSVYWSTHYNFNNATTSSKPKKIGASTINTLIINACIVALFNIGTYQNKEEMVNAALNILEELPPEKNTILHQWQQLGMGNSSAYQSQALLQQYKQYCTKKQCLSCGVFNSIVKAV
jgi:hypothetical protein